MVRLEIENTFFYSPKDESVFFGWIQGLAAVRKIHGQGRVLYVDIDEEALDDDQISELLGLFQRYKAPLKELKKVYFERFSWLKDETAYWYRPLFC